MMETVGIRIAKAASWFALGIMALITAFAVLAGRATPQGLVALALIDMAAIAGFLIQRYAITAGVGWGYCLWFYSSWMMGIYVFAQKGPPMEFGPMLGDLLEKMIVYTIFGVLPYLAVLFLEWLRSGKPAPEIIAERGYSLPGSAKTAASLNLVKCQKCATNNSADTKFCVNCGQRIEGNSACPECGAALIAGQKFCGNCGHKASF